MLITERITHYPISKAVNFIDFNVTDQLTMVKIAESDIICCLDIDLVHIFDIAGLFSGNRDPPENSPAFPLNHPVIFRGNELFWL